MYGAVVRAAPALYLFFYTTSCRRTFAIQIQKQSPHPPVHRPV